MIWFRSLRAKFILATLGVQIALSLLLVWTGGRHLEAQLTQLFEQRLHETTTLLEAAIATPLAQRDLSGIRDILSGSQSPDGLTYLVVRDSEQHIVAHIGWPSDQVLPEPHASFSTALARNVTTYDARTPIAIGGLKLGEISFGVDLSFIKEARRAHLDKALSIAAGVSMLSLLLMLMLATWLTRDLNRLSRASQAMAAGEPHVKLGIRSSDEIGALANNFDQMAATLAQRMSELVQAGNDQRVTTGRLEEERSRLDALLSSVRFGLLFESADGRTDYINPAFSRMWYLREDRVLTGLPLTTVATSIQQDCQEALTQPLQPLLLSQPDEEVEFFLADGRVVTQNTVPVNNADGSLGGRLWIFEDITKERQAADRLLFLAERDMLTGLYNRSRFDDELNRLEAHYKRNPGDVSALLYCDLDEFKLINDTYGHSSGDQVLMRVAQALKQLVRGNETLARLGGDEFAILTTHIDRTGAETLARRMLQTITELTFEFEGHRHTIGASIGVALFPEHAETVEMLVAHADAAMYEAKRSGKNNWRVYSAASTEMEDAISVMSWNERIDLAFERDLFVPYFQGIYGLKDQRLSHIEVLLRMRDPQSPDILIMPEQFIAAAARTQRIVAIDRWVIGDAVRRLAADPMLRPLAVNIAARSVVDPGMADYILNTLTTHGVEPRRLLLEVSETAVISAQQGAKEFISQLRQAGCSVCLDHFCSGFSSLAHLKQIDADILKIDGTFIKGLVQDEADRMFVKLLVEIAKVLGKRTVAEFVETEEAIERLESLGADFVQGFQLGRPSARPPTI